MQRRQGQQQRRSVSSGFFGFVERFEFELLALIIFFLVFWTVQSMVGGLH